jgi:hypothetical protein
MENEEDWKHLHFHPLFHQFFWMFHGTYWPFQALLDTFGRLLILLEGPDNLLIYGSSTGETLTSSSNDPTPLYTGERYLGSLFPNSLWSTQADCNLQLSYGMDQKSSRKIKNTLTLALWPLTHYRLRMCVSHTAVVSPLFVSSHWGRVPCSGTA